MERSRRFAPTARSSPRASPRAWTPACTAEPEARPLLTELHCRLEAALPSLNGERPVPAAPVAEPSDPPLAWLRASQLVALTAWGLAVTLVAAPLGRPGLALILGALTAPAILVASRLAWAPLPVLAPLLGALSARPDIPGRRRVAWGGARARRAGGARLVLAPDGRGDARAGVSPGPHPQGSARLEPLHVRGRQRAAVPALDPGGAVRGRSCSRWPRSPSEQCSEPATSPWPCSGSCCGRRDSKPRSASSPMAASAAAHC